MEKETNKILQYQKLHIAFLCSPGMGHLIPQVELAKRLIFHHGFSVTLLTFSNFSSPTQSTFLSSLSDPSISSITLPLISLDDLSPTTKLETRFCVLVHRSLPHIRSTLESLHASTNLAVFIPDLFCAETLSVAKEFSVPSYYFMPSNILLLSIFVNLPYLNETISCKYEDFHEPIQLPGCVPLHGEDLPNPIRDRNNEAYDWMMRLSGFYADAEGFVVNTFEEVESGVIGALSGKSTYLVGPLIRSNMDENKKDNSGCIAWLDEQPTNSVLFISFGSVRSLTMEQTNEIAFGLEASGQRFLWVVRSPSDKESNSQGNQDDPSSYLPAGFIERNKEIGMVVPSWAPQVKVLSHRAVGGFLSHCGWNSTQESVFHGVPMITWPLYAEQRMNAVMLEKVGIALRLKGSEERLVERGEIGRVVRELMEGERGAKVRCEVKKLQEAVSRTVKEGGKSYEALAELANKLKGGISAERSNETSVEE